MCAANNYVWIKCKQCFEPVGNHSSLQQSQHLSDPMDGFLWAKQCGNVEDTGTEFTSYQHEAEGQQKIAGLDGSGGSHLFKLFFQCGGVPCLYEWQLIKQLDKELLFGLIPFGTHGTQVDGRRVGSLEEKAALCTNSVSR